MSTVSSSRTRNQTGTESGRPVGLTVVNHAIRLVVSRDSTRVRRSAVSPEVSSMNPPIPRRVQSIIAQRADLEWLTTASGRRHAGAAEAVVLLEVGCPTGEMGVEYACRAVDLRLERQVPYERQLLGAVVLVVDGLAVRRRSPPMVVGVEGAVVHERPQRVDLLPRVLDQLGGERRGRDRFGVEVHHRAD